MNGRQLSDRIGNIDDRLIQQAEQLPERKKARLSDRAKHWVAAAVLVALMSASFSVGALAFSKETVVEVPVEQETLELTDIGITLILPDDWKGRYGVEQTGRNNSYHVYSTAVRDAFSRESVQQGSLDNVGGMLFYILKWDQQLTEEEWDDPFGEWNYAHNRYIMATKDGTYLLYYASDVQYTPETEAEYWQMRDEIETIRFVVDGALWEQVGELDRQSEEDDQKTVIARIQGEDFAVDSDYLKTAYYYYRFTQDPKTEAEVREFYVVQELLLRESSTMSGSGVTPAAVDEHIARLRENLSGDPEGYAEFCDYLRGLGQTEDEYWETHWDEYSTELTREKLGERIKDDYFSQHPDATIEEYQEYYRNEYRPWLFAKYQVEML